MRRLIINADDFGFTSGVNRAILEAHTRGIVTSSTLMAGGGAFSDAVRLANNSPELSVGCHVVLIDGKPILDPERLPSLTRSWNFHDGLKSFALRAISGQIDSREIATEASAQIRKIPSAGIVVSREYEEMRLPNLNAVGRAIRELANRSG